MTNAQIFRTREGGKIDREVKISFIFNGKKYYGYKGDTLASALLANGIHLIGRSFKYHRPRGIIAAGVEDANGKVQLSRNNISEPNVNITEVELVEGLSFESQNCWPSVTFDIWAINNFLNRFFPAGFYYKTFMGPHKKFWLKIYEPLIRRAAGLGKPPKEFKALSSHLYHNVDIVIVGGGLNGLLAAKSLINSKLEVLLIEFDSNLGGIINNSSKINKIDDKEPQEWLKNTIQEIEDSKTIKILTNILVSTYNYINHLIAVEDKYVGSRPSNNEVNSTLHKIRADHVILSNGHIERFLSFQNNDKPGIMLASSFEKYICRYGALPNNCLLYTSPSPRDATLSRMPSSA